jgi:4-carboxymuconolactone decarboxylase
VQAVHDATFAICHRNDLTDAEYAAAHAQLGDELMVELSAVVGYYTLLSMQLRIFRIPGDEPY